MRFYGYHGVLKEETKLGQEFIVDLVLQLDLSEAGLSDDLNKTVNYAELFSLCEKIVEGKPYKLIESIGEAIAKAVFTSFSAIDICSVKIIKPNPPIKGHYDSVAIEITRKRT